MAAPSLSDDPLDIRRTMLDLCELYCEEILTSSERERRVERLGQLNYLLERIGPVRQFGRLISRVKLAGLIADICARPTYEADDKSLRRSTNDPSTNKLKVPLVECTEEKWRRWIDKVGKARKLLLRKDANRVVLCKSLAEYSQEDESDDEGESRHPLEDETKNEKLASDRIFTDKFYNLVDLMRFHQALSPFRAKLEFEIDRAVEGRDSARVSPPELVKFEKFVTETFEEHEHYRNLLLSLLNGRSGSSRTRSAGVSLKPLDQLEKILDGKEFCLDRFQKKVEKLLISWADAVLPEPVLLKLGYGKGNSSLEANVAEGEGEDSGRTEERSSQKDDDNDVRFSASPPAASGGPLENKRKAEDLARQDDDEKENRKRAKVSSQDVEERVETLAHARDVLKSDVDDPLDESRAIAATVGNKTVARTEETDSSNQNRVQKGSLCAKKASAKSIRFEDSDEEEEGDERETAALSEVPERARVATSGDEGASSEVLPAPAAAGGRKRKRWTAEEKAAVKVGVERFGFGKWAQIKSYYSMELKDRSAVQIKDCYRTMSNNKEV